MHDPWSVLDLDSSADEASIRRRYLELVKQHPPERDPEVFRMVREAYELVRDPAERLKRQLFDLKSERQLDTIIEELRSELRQRRIPTDALLQLANVS